MGFGDFLSNILGTNNSFQALGPDGKPITQVGQSNFQAQNAPQQNYGAAIQTAMGNAQQNYNQQGDFIKSLQAQAMGQGPSVAQHMLQQASQANQQAGASAIASQRSMNPAMQARLMLDQQANAGQQMAGQGAMLRSQEMMNANGMLGSALGQQGAQNLGMFGQAGGLNQGQNALNLGTQQINANTAMGNAQQRTQGLGMNADVAHQNAATAGALVGGLANGLSGGLAGMASGGGGGHSGQISPDQWAAVSMDTGGKIPGRAQVSGDSPKNDKVKALLSPGEVVLPRSVADDPEKAAEFVRAIRRKKSADSGEGYGKVLAMHREHDERLKQLEALCYGGRV